MATLDRTCDGSSFEVFMVIFSIIDGIVCLLNMAILYLFVKRHRSQTESDKMSPRLFVVAVIFIIFVIATQFFMLAVVAGTESCEKLDDLQTHDHIFSFGWILCYLLQSYFLSMVTFMTLRDSVNGTAFEPSKCTVITYKILYVIIPILAVLTVMTQNITSNQSNLHELLMVFALFFLAMLFISTIVLYVRKLMAIYKHIDSDSRLITKITKLAILSTMSILLTLIIPIIMISILSTNPHFVVGSALFTFGVLIDTTTNAISITLTFPYFESYYVKMCGCLHGRCFVFCANCLGQQQRLLMDHEQANVDEENEIENQDSKGQTITQEADV